MRQHQKHVEHLEPDGRYRKKVDRNHGLHVVLQEGSPGWGERVVAAHQVLAHTRLANVDAELEQLSVNPPSAPEWILAAHLPNPCAHLLRHGRPSRLTVSDLPGPEPTKTFPVPADDRLRLDQDQTQNASSARWRPNMPTRTDPTRSASLASPTVPE